MSLKKWHGAEKKDEEDLQNVIVFGYQCKIFRDDEKALFIDKGNHLIPWMGDSSLMIDRYDGRGHISDLRPFDADNVDTSHYSLSDKEKAVEKAADEERYLELRTDVVKQQQYEEEEMKRLYESMGEGYAAVAFNYEQPQEVVQPQAKAEEGEEDDDEDFPYETIPELQVPKGVNLPASIKMHAIIEKTAAFVAKQGPQMEIVVATKQANNRQFDFLHYSHELNIYYKHIVKMVKNGKYTPRPQEEYSKVRRRRSSEGPGLQDYLHPSLGGGQEQEEVAPPQSQENFLKSVTAKLPTGQIANTAYAKLLTNLSKHRPESPVPSGDTANAKKTSGKKSSGSSVRRHESKKSDSAQPLVPGMDPVTLPGPNQPPPPGTEPLDQLPSHQSQQPAANGKPSTNRSGRRGYKEDSSQDWHGPSEGGDGRTEDGGQCNGEKDGRVYFGPEGPRQQEEEFREEKGGNSKRNAKREETAGSVPPDMVSPPSELRSIIDKMAQYVVRNGPEFSMMMKSKKDERFGFLEPRHKYNAYYESQVSEFRRVMAEAEREEGEGVIDSSTAGQRGVSFSIKAKEPETVQVAPKKRRALLADSDEEEDRGEGSTESGSSSDTSSEESDQQAAAKEVPLNSYTEECEATQMERKIVEENLKNRLALAARGKLVQAKEDDKVKAERKKKAAMFAALLKNNPAAESSESGIISRNPSVASLASLSGGAPFSREESPLPTTPSRAGSGNNTLTATDQYYRQTSSSRSRSRTPVSDGQSKKSKVSTTAETKSYRSKHSRSRSPKTRKRSRRHKSRSRSRSRSRHRHRRKRRYSSASNSPPPPKEAALPSAYTVMNRSSPPKEVPRRPLSTKSRSPSRHKRSKRNRSRSPRHSRSRRSRSRSRTRRHKRSRSKESKSKGKSKSSRKRSRSDEKKRSKKRKSKARMIPIPELPKSASSSSQSESEGERETITIDDSPEQQITIPSHEASGVNSLVNSPARCSDADSKCSDNAVKPSENLLLKVRAMLRAQREEAMKNGFPGD